MYTIKLDGKPLYSPAMLGDKYRIMAPKLTLDISTNGELSFVLPPGNHMIDAIRRRKSVVTVHQDGEEIFRGQVLDDHTDKFKQKNVYCEGIRSYLNDSQAAPYEYHGTPRGLLEKLIAEHNAQVEEEKHFVLGNITIDRADEALECENVSYWETFREIEEKLLGAYGGYLRVRVEGGVYYIDWLKEYGKKNQQKIRFAVNLIDIKDKNDSAEIFTILRPLGASIIGEDGEYGAPVTIESVNGGSAYIEDAEAIAKYGRIWHTQSWSHIEDPAKLLQKAREYMKIGAELRTITIMAIDMHFLDGSIQAIHAGDTVHILSAPHGIDIEKVCSRMEIDLLEPDKTIYTFGEAPQALTDNFVTAKEDLSRLTGVGGGSGRGSVEEQANGILRWASIVVDKANANIQLLTGEANSLNNRLSKAEVEIDGINAQILLKASQEEVDDLGMRMSAAEVEIDGANAQILLKASHEEVDDLGRRVSSAEIEIDGINSEITLKADKIDLKGYVTASQFSALESDLANVTSGTVQASHLYTQNLTATNTVRLAGYTCSWKTQKVVTGISFSKETITIPGGNGVSYVAIGGVSLTYNTAEIKYFGHD
jgi:hypothetical protein